MKSRAQSFAFGSLLRRPETGSCLGLAAVFLFFAAFGGTNFASLSGAASWLNGAAGPGIIAIPIGLLMIEGELDIFIGSLIPASSMTILAAKAGPTAKFFLGHSIGGIYQVTILWCIGAAAVFGFILHVSKYGNWILAMGNDKVSARNAGIPTERLTILLCMCSGVSAACVGRSQAILYNSAQVFRTCLQPIEPPCGLPGLSVYGSPHLPDDGVAHDVSTVGGCPCCGSRWLWSKGRRLGQMRRSFRAMTFARKRSALSQSLGASVKPQALRASVKPPGLVVRPRQRARCPAR